MRRVHRADSIPPSCRIPAHVNVSAASLVTRVGLELPALKESSNIRSMLSKRCLICAKYKKPQPDANQ